MNTRDHHFLKNEAAAPGSDSATSTADSSASGEDVVSSGTTTSDHDKEFPRSHEDPERYSTAPTSRKSRVRDYRKIVKNGMGIDGFLPNALYVELIRSTINMFLR